MLELREVGLRQGRRELARGLNLTLPDPGLYLFEGGTGSGKTLLAELLGGRRRPAQGRLLLDGESLSGPLGLPTRNLLHLALDQLPEGPQSAEAYLLDCLYELGAGPEAAAAVWPLLEQAYPGAAARPLGELPLGLRCLAACALAGCAPLRLVVLDAVLDLLDARALACGLRLLGLALQRQEAFVVLTSGRADLAAPSVRGRYALHWDGGLRVEPTPTP